MSEKINAVDAPPQKSITERLDLSIMLLYSARKKSAKPLPEYSTLYPETSSASASGRSKGCRFVSASEVIKKITAAGRTGSTNQRFSCACLILDRFRDPVSRSTEISVVPSETSYEILCAAERNPPKKAYLELLDQPALITE